MANPVAAQSRTVQREHSALAGVLSLMVPGFGQIYQGRIAKGILFFSCIYLLFFYGMYLGRGRNVYLPKAPNPNQGQWPQGTVVTNNPWGWTGLAGNLYDRPQYLAQFWVGIAAWPAAYQYIADDHDPETKTFLGTFQEFPGEETLNELQQESDKLWDLGWVLTVIAGALNVMVIYDAIAGPAFLTPPEKHKHHDDKEGDKTDVQ